jgi:hypothetical protein
MQRALLVLLLATCMLGSGRAHEGEQWIADGRMLDPVSKQWCCGPSDCHALLDRDVQLTHGGYLVKEQADSEPEYIPEARALPLAPDGRYHRCVQFNDGKAKSRCFIVPPRSF